MIAWTPGAVGDPVSLLRAMKCQQGLSVKVVKAIGSKFVNADQAGDASALTLKFADG